MLLCAQGLAHQGAHSARHIFYRTTHEPLSLLGENKKESYYPCLQVEVMTKRIITFCQNLMTPPRNGYHDQDPHYYVLDGEQIEVPSRLLDMQTGASTWRGRLAVSSKVKHGLGCFSLLLRSTALAGWASVSVLYCREAPEPPTEIESGMISRTRKPIWAQP